MGVLAGERKPSGDSGALKHQSGIMSGFYGPSVLLAQVGSVSALIVVAVAKTLWTKAVYTTLEFHFPLTACGVSCAVTIIALIPFFVFGESQCLPRPG